MKRTQKRQFDVREGDVWVFLTNYGGIGRNITGIDSAECGRTRRIYYLPWGEPYEKSCLLTTFRRWWRGAYLEFATDWNDRAI